MRPTMTQDWFHKLASPTISGNLKIKKKEDIMTEETFEEVHPYELIVDEPHGWIQTYSGMKFYPMNPDPSTILIEDIAHALSLVNRFTGHTKKAYSVAQHCVLVSYLCDSQDALYGLLHDASEAYLSDVARPLKRTAMFEGYRKVEANLQQAIYNKFDLFLEEPVSVKKADTVLLSTEARDLLGKLHPDWIYPVNPLPLQIVPFSAEESEKMFLDRFYELTA